MESQATAAYLTSLLEQEYRVITLGGAAVIAHGFARNTLDADIWLDPLDSPKTWAARLIDVLSNSGVATVQPITLGSLQPIAECDLATVVREDGMIRIAGLDRPLDIFRVPNELEAS